MDKIKDVFISWTSTDEELKNTIVNHLKSQNLTVLDSSCDCAGDFREWSDEAAQSCMVFVSLYTENTIGKKYVKVEIEGLQKLDDWRNRCVPVVSDLQMFKEQWPQLAESESAVDLKGRTITESHLKEIQQKVEILLRERMVDLYRRTTLAPYMRLVLPKAADEEVEYENLYVPRCCVQADNGEVVQDAELIRPKHQTVWYLQGSGGSGKSSYIHQLRRAADEDTLLMALPCRKLVGASDLLTVMYDELTQRIGVRDFYSLGAFRSALKACHLCLVLDGMDEIATEGETRAMVELVRTYYEANAQQTTLLFTGRNRRDADYLAMNGQQPKIVSLRAMEEEQMQTLGGNLMSAYHHKDKSAEFFTNVRKMPEDIANNPLLMTYLARIFVDEEQTMPRTVVEIFDKVMELTLFSEQKVVTVPHEYRAMMSVLPDILAAFAAERYRLLSEGKNKTSAQILARVLQTWYPDDASIKTRAEFLTDYLRDRGILVDDEFSHKMQLEYFTAKHYYHRCFDECDDFVGVEALGELFSHYADPYWAVVLEMFLSKADVIVDADNARLLYEQVTGTGITEFTLLFDVCRKLVCHREVAQQTLVRRILQQSAVGTFPPYGPLFWYVPEYDLYVDMLAALATLTEEGCYTVALALVRDVCWIFGRYNTAAEVSATVKGADLLKKASLTGVRKGLCELFYVGATAETGGEDVYPRCFNLAEAKEWKEKGYGVWGRMTTPFADELGLYAHEMYSELDGEYIGIVADAYCPVKLEDVLPRKSCQKLSGLFFSNGEQTAVSRLAINDAHVKAVYYPENMQERDDGGMFDIRWKLCRCAQVLQGPIGYFYDRVAVPAHVAEIPHHAFADCTSLMSIHIPDSVTKIGYSVFVHCRSLASIRLPDGVTSIEPYVFADCTSLTSIHLPDGVTKIGKRAFHHCTSLTSIHLPDSVTIIEEDAFSDCRSLREIHLPDSVVTIGKQAFKDCWALREIRLPDSVTTIGEEVFYRCRSLQRVENCPREYKGTRLGVGGGCVLVYRPYTGIIVNGTLMVPEGTVTVAEYAYEGLSDVVRVHIPDSVTTIGAGAFARCTSLASIHVPDGVTEIGWRAFEGCSSLKRIENCPRKYNRECLGVTEDCVLEYRPYPGTIVDGSLAIAEGTISIADYACARLSDVVCVNIPDGVTEIGAYAFAGCRSLTSIRLPDSVTKIGTGAFAGCRSLISIHLPDNLKIIGQYAFKGCASLTSIHLPDNLKIIGQYAFKGCTSLTSIRLPDGVEKIGDSMFEDCSSLKRIENYPRMYDRKRFGVTEDCVLEYCPYPGTIVNGTLMVPEGTVTVAEYAYEGLSDVVRVHIPDSVTTIGAGAFARCTSLASIHIPDGVTKIGHGTFYGCTSLKEIRIPDTVTRIDLHAFDGCTSLAIITIPFGVREVDDGAFGNCTGLREITLSRRFEHRLSDIFSVVDLSKVTIHWL